MAGTTLNKSLPYPTGSDPVALVDLQVKALADAVDTVYMHGSGTVSGAAVAGGALMTAVLTHGLGFTPLSVLAYISGFVSNSSPIVIKGVTAITSTQITVTLLNTATTAQTWTALPIRWVGFK